MQKFDSCQSVQFSRSVDRTEPTFCNPMDCTMPGFIVHHQLPEIIQNSCPSIRGCHPTILPSVIPFSSHLQSFPASGSFQMSQFFVSGGQSIGVSASASVLPMSIQDWLLSKGLSRVFSNTTVQKHHSSVLSFLYSATLTSIHDYRKNHNLD